MFAYFKRNDHLPETVSSWKISAHFSFFVRFISSLGFPIPIIKFSIVVLRFPYIFFRSIFFSCHLPSTNHHLGMMFHRIDFMNFVLKAQWKSVRCACKTITIFLIRSSFIHLTFNSALSIPMELNLCCNHKMILCTHTYTIRITNSSVGWLQSDNVDKRWTTMSDSRILNFSTNNSF